jgi:predicted nucleic acid-binding protein
MRLNSSSLIFADSNVFVEHLFIPDSAAGIVVSLATHNVFKLASCEQSIKEAETAILRKLQRSPELLNIIIERWTATLQKTKLIILPDPPMAVIKETNFLYLSSMRHRADIPILAAAILAKPSVILSGNREHFNDTVAQKCGIRIYSCIEFLGLLKSTKKADLQNISKDEL